MSVALFMIVFFIPGVLAGWAIHKLYIKHIKVKEDE